jgi:hypothetical protein
MERRSGVMLSIVVSLLAIAAAVLEVIDVGTYHMYTRGGDEENPLDRWFTRLLGDARPLCKLL